MRIFHVFQSVRVIYAGFIRFLDDTICLSGNAADGMLIRRVRRTPDCEPRALFVDRRGSPIARGRMADGEAIVNINAAGTGKGKYLNNNYRGAPGPCCV